MPYLNQERIVAYVPRYKEKFVCKLCLNLVELPKRPMKDHLELFHGLKVSSGVYVFFKEEA